jgi:phosphatidylserine/phosphatidylglycerophosphate/cardiolipin synthase-like enzyme
MTNSTTAFEVSGGSEDALFTLKAYRGEGMALLAMNWKGEELPIDFVGFAIEYMEPEGKKFYPVTNRLAFADSEGGVNPNILSTRLSPIQKFRWVHFPWHADIKGDYLYRVSPVFMNREGILSYGEYQQVAIQLFHQTYPGQLNVSFTRGFVSSQAFVNRFETYGEIKTLLPSKAKDGLDFTGSHPKSKEALEWMGFEARKEIMTVLENAVADSQAKVYVVAYDLNLPDMVSLLEQLKDRLMIIIDEDGSHGEEGSAENAAEQRLVASAGRDHLRRQIMGKLQHNKTIIVQSPTQKTVVCGSTNYSWRGFFVQGNNAIIMHGENAVNLFLKAFNNYWSNKNDAALFGSTDSAKWQNLGLEGIDASVTFSPHIADNAQLDKIGEDIANTGSNLFYSLAFLAQTGGPVRAALTKATFDPGIFVYGMADKEIGGFELLKPDGNYAPVSAETLDEHVPEPFKSESVGGSGTRLHHKFVVIDFDKPTARVYMGSYNFSNPADLSNGENLLLIKDRRIAVAYMIEALRIFDHYHFRIARKKASDQGKKLTLAKPPKNDGDTPWWKEYYSDPRKIRDRELFSS